MSEPVNLKTAARALIRAMDADLSETEIESTSQKTDVGVLNTIKYKDGNKAVCK